MWNANRRRSPRAHPRASPPTYPTCHEINRSANCPVPGIILCPSGPRVHFSWLHADGGRRCPLSTCALLAILSSAFAAQNCGQWQSNDSVVPCRCLSPAGIQPAFFALLFLEYVPIPCVVEDTVLALMYAPGRRKVGQFITSGSYVSKCHGGLERDAAAKARRA